MFLLTRLLASLTRYLCRGGLSLGLIVLLVNLRDVPSERLLDLIGLLGGLGISGDQIVRRLHCLTNRMRCLVRHILIGPEQSLPRVNRGRLQIVTGLYGSLVALLVLNSVGEEHGHG